MKRREFITHTVATASIAAVASRSTFAAYAPFRIAAVVFDTRLSDSRRFAEYFTTRGVAAFSLQEDIGRLWRGVLATACAQPATRIVGMTQYTELMISQLSAREFGATLHYQGRHECRGRQTLTHELPIELNASTMNLSDTDWPLSLASLLESTAVHDRASQVRGVFTGARRAPDHPGTLFSWLIGQR